MKPTMVFSAPRLSPAFPLVLLTVLITTSLALGAAVTQLAADEVAALKDIAHSLGKTNWDFSVDPCSEDGGWGKKGTDNAVTCSNASFVFGNDNIRHVTSIVLHGEGLSGTLPPGLTRLPYLQEFDVSRNYLSGTIPPEWGAQPSLSSISLLGNRLTGPIPNLVANISTLTSLVLTINQFSGPLPPELGNLSRLEKLHLTSNNFTGELPPTFAKLTALKELTLGDNQFQGKIPDFIQDFTHLEKLTIQASGLQGPIPSGIGLLANLSDLRITDLHQTESLIPHLQNPAIEYLMLRNCNLTGELPDSLVEMKKLTRLDLSFNKLSGGIPKKFVSLVYQLEYMFLTGNQLTGAVPTWMPRDQNIDLSYNNFTGGDLCQDGELNLFASSSEVDNVTLYSTGSGLVSCLKSSPCLQRWDNVSINCGGNGVIIGDTVYSADKSLANASSFIPSKYPNWAYSNTGYFLDGSNANTFVESNKSTLFTDNDQLYTDARLSPLSLTYYAYCLNNGSYSVSLHFLEIIFTGDKNYSSLGRRIFDVYIQGNKVLEDFDIVVEAGGAGKLVIKNFNTTVSNGTLEIRFYWAGKGTTAVPKNGVYGPLISAISMKKLGFVPPTEPGFVPPTEPGNLSTGAVVGIVFAIVFALSLSLIIIWWRGLKGLVLQTGSFILRQNKGLLLGGILKAMKHLSSKSKQGNHLKGVDLQTGSFTLRQIKGATGNFNVANKIGEGGFGSVYKGLLLDGTSIAVKQLSSKSKQGNREFVNEVGMISALQHPHLVKLYGCCIEGNQLLLIYEFMENNNLARALFGPEEFQLKLDWPTRHKICLGIARGLAYLHEESRLKIVHRDIKATNILLDADLNPKISDFGLAKLDEDNTHISTRIAGTYGYMAPEYAMHGYLTDKADIYSFGIVALEIASGRSNTSYPRKDECFYLLDLARVLKEKGNLIDLVDWRLGSDFNKKEAMVMIDVALSCSNSSPALRPAMSLVVSMLEGKTGVPALTTEGGVIGEDKFEAMRKHFIGDKGQEASKYSSQSRSVDGLWTGTASLTSGADIYPILLDSDNWHSRD